MKVMKSVFLLLGICFSGVSIANEGSIHLDKVDNNLCDKASLQRGAAVFMNYCSGCHSLKYVRFQDMAKDIGIVDKHGHVLEKVVAANLNFISDKITDPIQSAIPAKDAEKWFGVSPPDLSLVTKSRGKDWLYNYLRTFYEDPKKPWGVNNATFPDVGMPHILLELQGKQIPVYRTVKVKEDTGETFDAQVIDHLELVTPGLLTKEEYDNLITDLVNFLQYVGEPHQLERERIGVWVLLFLVIFTLFAYLLKREYWKDVH